MKSQALRLTKGRVGVREPSSWLRSLHKLELSASLPGSKRNAEEVPRRKDRKVSEASVQSNSHGFLPECQGIHKEYCTRHRKPTASFRYDETRLSLVSLLEGSIGLSGPPAVSTGRSRAHTLTQQAGCGLTLRTTAQFLYSGKKGLGTRKGRS